MNSRFAVLAALPLLICEVPETLAQTTAMHGQAVGWFLSDLESSPLSQTGFRYIPEFSVEDFSVGGLRADLELALNGYVTMMISEGRSARYDGRVKPYRAWLRLSTNTFEARVGLQKINFGSATLFRSLMWFDRTDPRDPLQLTDGVYGLLLRYYAVNNINLWLWGLFGNEIKGRERAPTREGTVEYGGRVQIPLFTGETAFTYHRRRPNPVEGASSMTSPGTPSGSENRFALDGKWDAGIGIWFEAVVGDQPMAGMNYRRDLTLGADYTFALGNGLNTVTEYFRSETAEKPFSSGEGSSLSALSLSYPFGIMDRISASLYYDWTRHDWYRIITWQRTYDNWVVYLLGFWNPQDAQLYHPQGGVNPFAGKGIQLMVVLNH